MKQQIYQVVHVLSVLVLFGLAFAAFAAPTPERRKRTLILSGIAAVVVLVTGFGLVSVVYLNQFHVWMFVKMFVWLVVAILAAIVFRQPSKATLFTWVTLGCAVLALVMVYMHAQIFGV